MPITGTDYTHETIQEARTEYSRQRFIEMITGKMQEQEARDTSDAEIERCLKNCVASSKLISIAKLYRSELRVRYSDAVTQLSFL